MSNRRAARARCGARIRLEARERGGVGVVVPRLLDDPAPPERLGPGLVPQELEQREEIAQLRWFGASAWARVVRRVGVGAGSSARRRGRGLFGAGAHVGVGGLIGAGLRVGVGDGLLFGAGVAFGSGGDELRQGRVWQRWRLQIYARVMSSLPFPLSVAKQPLGMRARFARLLTREAHHLVLQRCTRHRPPPLGAQRAARARDVSSRVLDGVRLGSGGAGGERGQEQSDDDAVAVTRGAARGCGEGASQTR